MATEAKHLHYIEHTHDTGYGISTRFVCKGDRMSPCHQYPPAELQMERWGKADERLFVPHDECWIESWMNVGCAVLCGPDREPVRSGPITVTFEDCVVWEYADDKDVQTRAAEKARSDAAWEIFSDRQGGA